MITKKKLTRNCLQRPHKITSWHSAVLQVNNLKEINTTVLQIFFDKFSRRHLKRLRKADNMRKNQPIFKLTFAANENSSSPQRWPFHPRQVVFECHIVFRKRPSLCLSEQKVSRNDTSCFLRGDNQTCKRLWLHPFCDLRSCVLLSFSILKANPPEANAKRVNT